MLWRHQLTRSKSIDVYFVLAIEGSCHFYPGEENISPLFAGVCVYVLCATGRLQVERLFLWFVWAIDSNGDLIELLLFIEVTQMSTSSYECVFLMCVCVHTHTHCTWGSVWRVVKKHLESPWRPWEKSRRTIAIVFICTVNVFEIQMNMYVCWATGRSLD